MNNDNKSSLLRDAEQEYKNNKTEKNLSILGEVDLRNIIQTIEDIKYQ